MASESSIEIIVQKINQSRREIDELKQQLVDLQQENEHLKGKLANADPGRASQMEREIRDLKKKLEEAPAPGNSPIPPDTTLVRKDAETKNKPEKVVEKIKLEENAANEDSEEATFEPELETGGEMIIEEEIMEQSVFKKKKKKKKKDKGVDGDLKKKDKKKKKKKKKKDKNKYEDFL